MLTKHMRDADRLAPVLEKITHQTFRASEIVNGLLNFSRTSGSEFTSVDLNDLLRDTTVLLEHQFKTAQIRVETNYDPQLPPIHGNRGKLQQVILNLMLNAKRRNVWAVQCRASYRYLPWRRPSSGPHSGYRRRH